MYRVYGDIENRAHLFRTVITNLRTTPSYRRSMYLGDLYSPHDSSQCISQIEQILAHHEIEIHNIFNDENIHDHDFLRSIWDELYELKHICIYKTNYVQFFGESPLKYETDSGHIPHIKRGNNNGIVPRRLSNRRAQNPTQREETQRDQSPPQREETQRDPSPPQQQPQRPQQSSNAYIPFPFQQNRQPQHPLLRSTNRFNALAEHRVESPTTVVSAPVIDQHVEADPIISEYNRRIHAMFADQPPNRPSTRRPESHRQQTPIDYNQSLGSINGRNAPIFLFGNKDVYFMLQMKRPITFVTTDDHKLIVTYHSFRHHDNGELKTNTYTAHELNVMHTYLSNCRHYYVDDNVLYIHCYGNARKVRSLTFNKIVCGHNKGFGFFHDDDYTDKHIFMLDYTVIKIDSLIPPRVYFDVSNSFVKMMDDRFYPTILPGCKLVSVSDRMVSSPNGDAYIDEENEIEIRRHRPREPVVPTILNVPVSTRLHHVNRYTRRHNCYSDSELMDDLQLDKQHTAHEV